MQVKRERTDSYGAAEAADIERRKRANVSLPEANLDECVAKYLSNMERFTQHVNIVHPTVAQRSYGHEKRYLCPPPLVRLEGPRWREELIGGIVPRLRVTCDGNTSDLSLMSEDERLGLHAVSKSLYIADHGVARPAAADAAFDIMLNDEQKLGTFRTAMITVISKPIKKIRSDRPDMCIKANSPVALFNRVRGQTVSTRYLCVDGAGDTNCGLTSSGWSAFELVSAGDIPQGAMTVEKQLSRKAALLCHGQTFRLKDSLTGKMSPPIVLHKVDKNMVLMDNDEPVSQLMKVALCVPSAGNQYLSVNDGVVSYHKAIPHPDNANRAIIMEGAAWTISSTKSIEYSFADMRRSVSSSVTGDSVPIHSVPSCFGASIISRNGEPIVELRGEGLDVSLVCFVGRHRLDTLASSGQSTLHVIIPKELTDKAKEDMPLLLARKDGVLFPTPHFYSPSRRCIVSTGGVQC